MTFEFRPGTYVSRIFFVESRNCDKDWMGVLYRTGENEYRLRYRFRYYVAPGPDAPDKKHWYEGKCTGAIDEVLPKMRLLVNAVVAEYGGPGHELTVDSDDPQDVMRALAAQPWAHFSFGHVGADGEVHRTKPGAA